VAKFQQISRDKQYAHHDDLEFPDGKIVLVKHLSEAQHATVLQLPVLSSVAKERKDVLVE